MIWSQYSHMYWDGNNMIPNAAGLFWGFNEIKSIKLCHSVWFSKCCLVLSLSKIIELLCGGTEIHIQCSFSQKFLLFLDYGRGSEYATPNMTLKHKHYFELKAIEKQHIWKNLSTLPFMYKSRALISLCEGIPNSFSCLRK